MDQSHCWDENFGSDALGWSGNSPCLRPPKSPGVTWHPYLSKLCNPHFPDGSTSYVRTKFCSRSCLTSHLPSTCTTTISTHDPHPVCRTKSLLWARSPAPFCPFLSTNVHKWRLSPICSSYSVVRNLSSICVPCSVHTPDSELWHYF